MIRLAAFLAGAMIVAVQVMAPAPALAVEPPIIPPGPPPTGAVAPPDPTEQKSVCGVGTTFPGSDFTLQPSAEAMVNYSDAWKFSRGAGQKVAVIDTGVTPNPRLRVLEGGGDYVSSSDGLVDCDAHGTLVAGLIAAAPGPEDAFAGVAPDAAILSIRQNSGVYAVRGAGSAQNDPNAVSAGYGSTRTLALAIVHAVDLGATVINLSEVACAPVGAGMDDAELGKAVRYAYERNVVVVAAAGNFNKQGLCNAQNEVPDPNLPLADAWRTVHTIASPAWFDDYVLAVGALTPDGEPADFSLRGPWVDVAAPGENVVSLGPAGPGLINAWQDQTGVVPINGTSFAAPIVSGVVALLRARFPSMSAGEVMDRIRRTAHTGAVGPNAATGYGVVDPVAALTYQMSPAAHMPDPDAGRPIAGPASPDVHSQTARNVILAVCGLAVVFAVIAVAVLTRRRS
jgi:membrane-anchored mycosin MYCP